MTERIIVNRKEIFLTIDNIRENTQNGIVEHPDKFVVFYKKKAPNEIDFGEQIKNQNSNNMIFSSIIEAKNYATEYLERIIYPEYFLNPLSYRKENISEIMHKQLIFDIGKINSDKIEESIRGVITECKLAANEPNLPGEATIHTEDGQVKQLTFFEIKNIRI